MPAVKNKTQSRIVDVTMIKGARLVLRALDHPTRLKILEVIDAAGEINVTDLYVKMRLEQSVASQYLAILRRAGVVTTRRDGKCIYYSVNHNRIKEVEKHSLYMLPEG